jgi:E3 ubiquitin-protein ligase TRIP12
VTGRLTACLRVQVQYLLTVMSELGPDDKRLFLRFITGSPRLPIGGFAGLSPKLTIVKASTAPGTHQDEKLPTCSTCQVYLKLPPYTSIDILREKLLFAIREGQEHFAMD